MLKDIFSELSRRLPIIWTAVLSHHRTCRSAYGGSVTCVQCFIAGNSEPLQVFKPRVDAFPLLPDIASDFTLNPAIGLLHKFFHICNGIIVQPTCCVLTLFLQHLFQTASLFRRVNSRILFLKRSIPVTDFHRQVNARAAHTNSTAGNVYYKSGCFIIAELHGEHSACAMRRPPYPRRRRIYQSLYSSSIFRMTFTANSA